MHKGGEAGRVRVVCEVGSFYLHSLVEFLFGDCLVAKSFQLVGRHVDRIFCLGGKWVLEWKGRKFGCRRNEGTVWELQVFVCRKYEVLAQADKRACFHLKRPEDSMPFSNLERSRAL